MQTGKDNMIHIGPNWALQGDDHNITLYKRRVTQKGTVQWDACGYFQDFRYALKRMVDMQIGPLNHVESIVKAIDNIREHIDLLPSRYITG